MKDIYDFIKSFDLHTIIVVGIAFWWMNSGMNEQFKEIRSDISELKTDIRVIKTILVMKGIMPQEMCKTSEEK
jgi:hypothetical protein